MLRQLFLRLRKMDLFRIDPKYFPENTRKMIPINQILQWGALPLGIKANTVLNIGLLNPYHLDARDSLERSAREQGKTACFYKVIPDDFVKVLKLHYGIDPKTITNIEIDETLRRYLTSESQASQQ